MGNMQLTTGCFIGSLKTMTPAIGAVLVAITITFHCGQLPAISGTSSGVETKIVTGLLRTEEGYSAQDTRVVLLPAHYDPFADPAVPDSMTDTTDEAGIYILKSPLPGLYTVEAVDISTKKTTLISGISIERLDTTRVRTAVLRLPGSITIALPDTFDNGYVYLPGTTCFAPVQKGSATIESAPAGLIPSLYYANTADPAKDHVIRKDLTVSSGVTSKIIDLHNWKYSKKLYLNTTANGAGVPSKVCSFPVLVRLTAVNFPFFQAAQNGACLRFTKSDSATPLPFEIERWDAGSQQAEIWVQVDTVYGNDSTHFIIMHWGASTGAATMPASNGAAVFNSANGYQGVWHLGATVDGRAGDASPNNFHGRPSDTAPVPIIGMIGQAREFNGNSNYFTMAGTSSGALDFPENGIYSVSAWAYTDTLDSMFHTIVGKGAYQYNLEITEFNEWEFAEFKNMSGWDMTTAAASIRQWVYLTGVRKGANQYLYINGQCADSTIGPIANVLPRNTSADVTIGKIIWPANENTPYFYDGGIDEVRIANVAQSADWIKLCYMNQKTTDALVVFK